MTTTPSGLELVRTFDFFGHPVRMWRNDGRLCWLTTDLGPALGFLGPEPADETWIIYDGDGLNKVLELEMAEHNNPRAKLFRDWYHHTMSTPQGWGVGGGEVIA